MINFTGKNILVVGGSSGIGLSLVNALSTDGATVYSASRRLTNDWIGGVRHINLDVLGDINSFSAQLPEKLHGLAYCAGSINLKPFPRLTEEDFLADFKLNVIGAARVIQQALKALKSAGGSSIVLISSVAAKTGLSFHASIGAAKGGLEGLALSLAAELAPHSIRVNVVAPSLTDTPMAHHLLSTAEKKSASAKRHPLGKYGEAADISAMIAFLLSEGSSWTTGQVIGIDGGMGTLTIN